MFYRRLETRPATPPYLAACDRIEWMAVMTLYKLRIALASTILALAAVSATADSASARSGAGSSSHQIVGSKPTSISGLRRAIMMLYGAAPVLAGPVGQTEGIAGNRQGRSAIEPRVQLACLPIRSDGSWRAVPRDHRRPQPPL
jgi:hypothetical protein